MNYALIAKYWPVVMAAVHIIEAQVPKDTPGPTKLDMGIQGIIELDESAKNAIPELTAAFKLCKSLYNKAKALVEALTGKPPATGAPTTS